MNRPSSVEARKVWLVTVSRYGGKGELKRREIEVRETPTQYVYTGEYGLVRRFCKLRGREIPRHIDALASRFDRIEALP